MNSHPSTPVLGARKAATRQPLLWAALAYAGGIFVGHYAWRPPLWWLHCRTGIRLLGALFPSSAASRWDRSGLVFTLFVFGALTIQVGGPASGEIADASLGDGQDVIITAHVIREGSMLRKGLVTFNKS